MPNEGIAREDLEHTVVDWWSHKGFKMDEGVFDRRLDALIIANGEVAKLAISKLGEEWLVSWFLLHGSGGRVTSKTLFSTDELKAAFAIEDSVPASHPGWPDATYHDAASTVSVANRFIRYGRCLNLPGPSRQHNDPNLSLWVTRGMTARVAALIERAHKT